MSDERIVNDRVADRIAAWYEEPMVVDPAHRDRVAAMALAHRPQPWRIGLLAAAALLVAVLVVREWRQPVVVSPVSVRFVLRGAPEAARVTLVGDFNGWSLSATPLARTTSEPVWAVDVRMRPGRYGYAFVVDGHQWVADPTAPLAPDDFGRPTSVIVVGGDKS